MAFSVRGYGLVTGCMCDFASWSSFGYDRKGMINGSLGCRKNADQ